jgi:hypothetical protein
MALALPDAGEKVNPPRADYRRIVGRIWHKSGVIAGLFKTARA